MQRRHDIDALRAMAFGLVILYHVGMYDVAGWHWHLKSPAAVEWLQWPMRALNLWRMDLVFLISGLALGFLRRGQGPLTLLGQRSRRLLIPLAFGMLVLIPFQPYAQALANGYAAPGLGAFLLRYFSGGPWPAEAFDGAQPGITWNHLWYLPYLWFYTAVLLLALPWLDSAPGQRLRRAFTGLRGAALLLLPALPLVLYALTLLPRFAPSHDLVHDAWLHALYGTLFLYGWWIGLDAGFWAEARRLRWVSLSLALTLLLLPVAWHAIGSGSPLPTALTRVLAHLYKWIVILAALGWAHHRLNRPWPWLAWANDSVYPWYLLHQTVIIVAIFWLAPLHLPMGLEAALLLLATVAGCWSITALVRRSRWLRPLFGLPQRPLSRAATAQPAQMPVAPPEARCAPRPASLHAGSAR
jgi:peptidoglycan/LPS O-acetylase OafA/YrhL